MALLGYTRHYARNVAQFGVHVPPASTQTRIMDHPVPLRLQLNSPLSRRSMALGPEFDQGFARG